MSEEVKQEETKETTKETPPGPQKETPGSEEPPKVPEEKTAKIVKTQEEFDQLVQSETDKRVSQAIQTVKEKADKEKAVAVEAERKKLADQKLRDEGQYQELSVKLQGELDEKKAQEDARAFTEESKAALAEIDCSAFADILVSPKNTVADVRRAGEDLKKRFEDAVEIEVDRRLETGPSRTPKGKHSPSIVKFSDLKTVQEKTAFIEEHGLDAFQELLHRAQGE